MSPTKSPAVSAAPSTDLDPPSSFTSSHDNDLPAPPLIRRSSSSKARFSELNFGDPSFGLKVKSSSKKRGRSDGETPPDKLDSTSAREEAEKDSFARHLIRKKFKYSDLSDDEIVHPHGNAQLLLPEPGDKFALSYDMSDDDETSSVLSPSALKPGPSQNEIHANPSVPRNDGDSMHRTAVAGLDTDSIWFTGSELPRVLGAVRSTESDDIENPMFYSILKPVPKPDQQAVDDELRFQGPWADRLSRDMAVAINEACEGVEEDESKSVDSDRAAHGEKRQLVSSVSSDENDFSESQVAIDQHDFSKNFGHQHKPLTAYWERQRQHLACQKLPVRSSSTSSPSTSHTSERSSPSTTTPMKQNYNKLITDQLEKLEAICLGSGDQWRGYAYRKAANILKAISYKIDSMEEALKLRGIGTSIAEKIGEIIATGKLRKLDALQNEERIQILSTFMGIFGVGQSTANKWCALGYKTLDDITKHATLTYAQAVGLNYYHEFKLRIPRQEMETICKAIKKVIHEIDKDFIVEICGSYRRGKQDCGDIDIIITHKRPTALKNILHDAVPKLHEAQVLTHDFVTINEGSDKYMGVCRATSHGLHRRIDMLTVPPVEWPFALIYFTGSGHFNRSMRFWAGKRGYSLSQHGLRVNYGYDNKGPYIAGITTEKQIFEALGLEYRPPEDRDV